MILCQWQILSRELSGNWPPSSQLLTSLGFGSEMMRYGTDTSWCSQSGRTHKNRCSNNLNICVGIKRNVWMSFLANWYNNDNNISSCTQRWTGPRPLFTQFGRVLSCQYPQIAQRGWEPVQCCVQLKFLFSLGTGTSEGWQLRHLSISLTTADHFDTVQSSKHWK